MKPFEDKHGVAFDWGTVTDDTLPNYQTIYTVQHTHRDYGLFPRSAAHVSAPEVNTSQIYVPGMDGAIDTTESLDGLVHYKNREFTAELTMIDAKEWHETYHALMRDLHGKKKRVVIDDDNKGYYEGRLTVSEPEVDNKRGTAFFTVSGNMEPYQYDFKTTGEDWLWGPFLFSKDSIRRNYKKICVPVDDEYHPTTPDVSVIPNGVKIPLYASDYPVIPHISVVEKSEDVSGVIVSYENIYGDTITKSIEYGEEPTDAKFSDLILCSIRKPIVYIDVYPYGDNYLASSDYAYIKIDYRTGRL